MIDRYLLRYFLAVIEEGNFSRAAARCNVSQPTLSIGIGKLEGTLGRTLFNRTNRRVELTAAGAELAVRARRIEAEFLAAEREGASVAIRPTTRIGILYSISTAWLSRIARQCARTMGEERVEFVEGRERDLIERLTRGRIDAALTIIRPNETRFASEPLLTEGYALAMADNHPLAARPAIAAEELSEEVMIVRRHCEVLAETSRYFTERGVRPFFTARTFNDDRAMALVQAGMGLTVMPDSFAAPGVARPRLMSFDLARTIGLLFARDYDSAPSPALEAIRDIA